MLGIVASTGTAAGISQLSHCTKSRDGIDTTPIVYVVIT
jgi:hypothetical protein